LDADRIVTITRHVVRAAAAAENCVIVGRGSQYFLRDRTDTYHVFICAPYEEKLRRELQSGKSATQAKKLIGQVDRATKGAVGSGFDSRLSLVRSPQRLSSTLI
jgi:cytidylate kinase